MVPINGPEKASARYVFVFNPQQIKFSGFAVRLRMPCPPKVCCVSSNEKFEAGPGLDFKMGVASEADSSGYIQSSIADNDELPGSTQKEVALQQMVPGVEPYFVAD